GNRVGGEPRGSTDLRRSAADQAGAQLGAHRAAISRAHPRGEPRPAGRLPRRRIRGRDHPRLARRRRGRHARLRRHPPRAMPAQTVSFPLPARMLPERIPLLHFLRTELAPFPGRAIGMVRVVVACSVVLVLCMTLRIPEPHLAVWVVTRVAMEGSRESRLAGLVFLVALTVGLAIPLVLFTFAMDQAWLRFCLMAAMAFLGLFLRQTFVIAPPAFVIGLIGAVLMTAPDFIPIPELVVRGSLWLWPIFAL